MENNLHFFLYDAICLLTIFKQYQFRLLKQMSFSLVYFFIHNSFVPVIRGQFHVLPPVIESDLLCWMLQVDSIVTPLRSSMRSMGDAVKSAPDSLIQTVDGMVGGLSRAIRGPAGPQTDEQLLRDPALLDTEVSHLPRPAGHRGE